MQKLKELIKNEYALKCASELNQAGFIISIDVNNTNYFHFLTFYISYKAFLLFRLNFVMY